MILKFDDFKGKRVTKIINFIEISCEIMQEHQKNKIDI